MVRMRGETHENSEGNEDSSRLDLGAILPRRLASPPPAFVRGCRGGGAPVVGGPGGREARLASSRKWRESKCVRPSRHKLNGGAVLCTPSPPSQCADGSHVSCRQSLGRGFREALHRLGSEACLLHLWGAHTGPTTVPSHRLYLGCISAVSRLPLDCISAVSRLYLGCVSAHTGPTTVTSPPRGRVSPSGHTKLGPV